MTYRIEIIFSNGLIQLHPRRFPLRQSAQAYANNLQEKNGHLFEALFVIPEPDKTTV